MAGVTQKEGFAARRARLMNRLAALRAGYARPSGGFLAQPEPRSIGAYARGRQLLSGTYLLAGQLVEAPRQSLWEVEAPSPAFAAEAQGFGWLDDLAALGDAAGATGR
ncbi:heparinase, partial [Cereibacter changlensis]